MLNPSLKLTRGRSLADGKGMTHALLAIQFEMIVSSGSCSRFVVRRIAQVDESRTRQRVH